MPIYNFKCPACDESFEKIVKMGAEETECKCGETAKKDFKSSLFFSATGLPNGHNSIRGKIRSK